MGPVQQRAVQNGGPTPTPPLKGSGSGLTISERRNWLLLLLLWLLSATVATMVCWHSITGFRFWDPDDAMRLLEVRDWLAGQSWFDVSQHRMNLPAGLSMHWSRLLDVPLAALILSLKPAIGQRAAETVASVVVPMLILGGTMSLVAAIARHRSGAGIGLLAAAFCLLSVGTWYAMLPMRIDHHGYQILCGLGMAWALVTRRDRRGAALAGLCGALWTHISLEGLAFTLCAAGWLSMLAIADRGQRQRLAAFFGALAAASLALYLSVHSLSVIGQTFCDQISSLHVAIFSLAAVLSLAGAALPGRSLAVRIAVVAITALACAALYHAWAPQCAAGPFGTLGPLGRGLWYMNVHEGRRLWEAPLETRLSWGLFPWIGLAGAVTITAFGQERGLERWSYCILLAGAIAIGLAVTRAGAFANLLAIPGAVGLVVPLMRRTEAWPVALRLLPRAAAILLLSPFAAQSTPVFLAPRHDVKMVAPKTAAPKDSGCGQIDGIAPLDRLPATTVMAPLELGPVILAGSHHFAVTGPYHRDPDALEDVLRFFTTDPATARAIAARRHAGLVVFCPNGGEMTAMAKTAPKGLAASLLHGPAPAWLSPLRLSGSSGLAVYRIAAN